MSCSLASSSRTVLNQLSLSPLGSTRGILHRARPPRIPKLNSPHTPKLPLPTSGTSRPIDPSIPSHQTSTTLLPSTTHAKLDDGSGNGLTVHYSPPPSLPSYTNGSTPPLLQWLNGKSITLSGEEKAETISERKVFGEKVQWDQGVVNKMKDLRSQGASRREIGESLNIPKELHRLIPRLAPQSSTQKALQATNLEEEKSTWGYRKKLARAVREKRKTFW